MAEACPSLWVAMAIALSVLQKGVTEPSAQKVESASKKNLLVLRLVCQELFVGVVGELDSQIYPNQAICH